MPTEKNKTNSFYLDNDLTFIFFYRKLLRSPVFHNEGLLKVWVWCLLKATHSEKRSIHIVTGKGISEIEIKKGQFVFGRKKAAKELNMKPNTVYKRIKKLEKLKNIIIQSNTHCSIISITNWQLYQNEIPQWWQANGQASVRQVSGKCQASNTGKNGNNENNEKECKKKKRKKSNKTSSPDIDSFMTEISENKSFQKFLEEKRINYTQKPLESIIEACFFWHDDKEKKHKDWVRTLRNWINKGIEDYKTIPVIESIYPRLRAYDDPANPGKDRIFWELGRFRNEDIPVEGRFSHYTSVVKGDVSEDSPPRGAKAAVINLQRPELNLPFEEAQKFRDKMGVPRVNYEGKEI